MSKGPQSFCDATAPQNTVPRFNEQLQNSSLSQAVVLYTSSCTQLQVF